MKKMVFVLGIALCSLSSFAAKKEIRKSKASVTSRTAKKFLGMSCYGFTSSCGYANVACIGGGGSLDELAIAIDVADRNQCPENYCCWC